MIIQVIKFKSNLTEENLLRTAHERVPQFKALSGLLQKYYFKTNQPGEYGGIYVWDSAESLQTYRISDLAASIPGAYEVVGTPNIELMEVLFTLRS